MNVCHFKTHIIEPTLHAIGMHSESAVQILLGTAAKESMGFQYLKQLGGGPALGLYQIEPDTLAGTYEHYLKFRSELKAQVNALIGLPGAQNYDPVYMQRQLICNLDYATAIARIKYYRADGPLPAADDITGMAAYWKKNYNTPGGLGTEQEWIDFYNKYIKGA